MKSREILPPRSKPPSLRGLRPHSWARCREVIAELRSANIDRLSERGETRRHLERHERELKVALKQMRALRSMLARETLVKTLRSALRQIEVLERRLAIVEWRNP